MFGWIRAGGLLALVIVTGCGRKEAVDVTTVSDHPIVRIVHATERTIVRRVAQPSFIEAYEQTAIYPKMSGYVGKWNVDIGDRIKKGDVLATLLVPELEEEHAQKLAQHLLDQELVTQAEHLVDVARSNHRAATSRIKEAEAIIGKYRASVRRWQSEVDRLNTLTRDRVIAEQVRDESVRQLESNQASVTAADASVETARASALAVAASLKKSQVDVRVAQARVGVSAADVRRLAALVGYLKLTAPYDGVVVARNANTGDFVLPSTGDPSARRRSEDQSSAKAAPIYVVARTDTMRIFIDVPEADAIYVHSDADRTEALRRKLPVKEPTPALVRVRAVRDREFTSRVKRASWSLDSRSRTLRTEIDLPNGDGLLRPGMYAVGELVIERAKVKALPVGVLTEMGEETGCYLLIDGKAVRTVVRVGTSDGQWTEVLARRATSGPDVWTPFTGREQVIQGDLSELTDGKDVRVDDK